MPTHQPPRSGILARGPAALRAAAVLAALVVAWAPDAFLGLGTYWHHDLRTHHYPWRAWGAARWLQGRRAQPAAALVLAALEAAERGEALTPSAELRALADGSAEGRVLLGLL